MARSHAKVLGPGDRFTRQRGDRWPDLSAVPAVAYMLRCGGTVVYVGYSTKIQDRLTAHTRKWWDSVEIVCCASPVQAHALEGDLIFQHRPRYNQQLTHHGKNRQ